ncbi:MAG: hypothetical protein Q8O41_08430 [Candidatus Methanoperedens sp.]|nr:hypothetical protein [Candidatus Methanoperedens sp.]MDP2767459.1 hypothetical protein [Candidatus Methanoperedens sp.]
MNTTDMPRYKGGIGTDVKKASDIIKKNGIVVYPTETVYGIGANILLRYIHAKRKGSKNVF